MHASCWRIFARSLGKTKKWSAGWARFFKIGNGVDFYNNLPYLLTDTDHPAFDLTQEDVNNIKDLLFSEHDKIYTDKVK